MADATLPRSDFYVYVLFRHDTGEPFYVGKGCGRRFARTTADRRNPRKRGIVDSAHRDGLEIPAVKIAEWLTETQAFDVERAFIAAIGREPNGPLINLTDGGDGTAGFYPSEATRAKLSAIRKGRVWSAETLAKRSVALKGRKFSAEWKAKLSASHKGNIPTEVTRAKMSASRLGRVVSDATKQKASASQKGRKLSPDMAALACAALAKARARRWPQRPFSIGDSP